MYITCVSNSITDLPRKIQRFAFTQNDKGSVDLTVRKEYEVFGVRINKSGKFYLVLTDSVHCKLPWWMPAAFFNSPEDNLPENWESRTWGAFRKDVITAHPAYFDAIEDIEDGTPKGYEAFRIMRQSSAD